MAKKDKNKTEKKGKYVYPKKGVNRLWDALFELEGIDKVFDAIPNEETKREILNFTAGLSAKMTTEIEKLEKDITPTTARQMYAHIAKDLGKNQKEIDDTIQALKDQELGLEGRMKEELAKKEAAEAKNSKDSEETEE